MEYFIGLTFDPSSIHYQKIASFRQRFDSKFKKASILQLTILPPFSVDFKNKAEESGFLEDLSDVLDGHLMGLENVSQFEFNGITFNAGKNGSLSLTPIVSTDFLYIQESLYSVLKDYGVKFKKTHDLMSSKLPIGRFEESGILEGAVEVAKVEFSSPFVMSALSFIIFEKTPKEWAILNNLYDFEIRDPKLFVKQNYA
ncbi:MAG: hypothetical protein K2Q18_08200 [Bdellovibrionales bacterium]|nr:hypothetical protein [Bdellovibrionales bacterium]